jgi:hypothetical protein
VGFVSANTRLTANAVTARLTRRRLIEALRLIAVEPTPQQAEWKRRRATPL